ncbi:MAG: ribosomal-protein-alanine N-acetyltransferase [Thermoprotei archaeon]|nr:MAG: ribosomal-protein-alanine N-acetyltransferase [Thermoprotei archaeon]
MAGDSSTRAVEGLSVREVRYKDIPAIYEIERLCFKDPYELPLLQMYYAISRSLFLVSEREGRVVGYAIGLAKKWGEGHVISIAVHPEWRRRGVGKRLMLQLLEKMRRMGVRWVRLEVRVSNEAAINLYRRLGFSIEGVLKGYYRDGEDAYLMIKVLEA